MYIQSFFIESFGIFSDALVENLSPGLTILLGRNEAGKSTCLEFLRVMLTGFPSGNSNEGRRLAGLLAGQKGGHLTLVDDDGRIIRLTRRPGPSGTGAGSICMLADDNGAPMDPAILTEKMGGISRDVFRAVFGFGLNELQDVATLNGGDVSSALYGASFGLGIRSPGEALRGLDASAGEIFRPRSQKGLNKILVEWEELRSEISRIEQDNAQYDALAEALSQRRAELADVRRRKLSLEDEHRQLERRLGVWRQWEEWRKAEVQLGRLDSVDDTFPEDGQARLARLQEATEACRREVAAHQNKIAGLQERRDSIVPDQALLDILPALRALAERKTSYRQASGGLAGMETRVERAEADLIRELERLGPGWNCDRIRETDRSLFAREDLERQAREMTDASLAHQSATLSLGEANRDAENIARDVAVAQAALDELPSPEAPLDEEGRDTLREALSRVAAHQERIPQRRRAAQNSINAFARFFDPLDLPTADPHAALTDLLNRRDDAIRHVAEMQDLIRASEEAVQAARQAEANAEAMKQRVESLREEQRTIGGPKREDIERRAAAVRKLHAISATLESERERIKDLDTRMEMDVAPAPSRSMPLLVSGGILAALGVAILVARWQFGLDAVELSPDLLLPISLWSGYLVLVCGVVALCSGLPRSSPETDLHRKEMDQIRERREACQARVAELEAQGGALCAEAQVDSMDIIELEAIEVLLERDRERCFSGERVLRDAAEAQRALAQARTDVSELQARAREAENAVQQSRRHWHDFMQGLGVGNVPAPEGAEAFFERAEAALSAWQSVDDANTEVDALETELAYIKELIRDMPPVSARLAETDADGDDFAAVQDAAGHVLDSCREADAVREQRIKASAALQNRQSELERIQQKRVAGEGLLRVAEQRLEKAREQWKSCLRGLGLGDDLNPETVREAFESMERSLVAEAALTRAREEAEQARKEIADLRGPLGDLLRGMDRGDRCEGADVDWIALLDAVQEEAERASDARAEQERLDDRISEERDALRAAQASAEEAQRAETALLGLAGAADAEDFLRKAAQITELRDLRRRYADLGDSLRIAAGPMEFGEFVKSFEEENQEDQERRRDAMREELAGLQAAEQHLSEDAAKLSARVDAMGSADTLAEKRQKEADMRANMDAMAREWSRLAITQAVIRAARKKFEQERQPQVIRQASEIFSSITNGKWRGISAALDDRDLLILPAQGEPTKADTLSRGTMEQAYLALRLAYIQDHAEHSAPLPIVMDDVLVNFDPGRATRTARAILELSEGMRGPAHQIFYFTCHPAMADILREVQPAAVLLHIENGKITRV